MDAHGEAVHVAHGGDRLEALLRQEVELLAAPRLDRHRHADHCADFRGPAIGGIDQRVDEETAARGEARLAHQRAGELQPDETVLHIGDAKPLRRLAKAHQRRVGVDLPVCRRQRGAVHIDEAKGRITLSQLAGAEDLHLHAGLLLHADIGFECGDARRAAHLIEIAATAELRVELHLAAAHMLGEGGVDLIAIERHLDVLAQRVLQADGAHRARRGGEFVGRVRLQHRDRGGRAGQRQMIGDAGAHDPAAGDDDVLHSRRSVDCPRRHHLPLQELIPCLRPAWNDFSAWSAADQKRSSCC